MNLSTLYRKTRERFIVTHRTECYYKEPRTSQTAPQFSELRKIHTPQGTSFVVVDVNMFNNTSHNHWESLHESLALAQLETRAKEHNTTIVKF